MVKISQTLHTVCYFQPSTNKISLTSRIKIHVENHVDLVVSSRTKNVYKLIGYSDWHAVGDNNQNLDQST